MVFTEGTTYFISNYWTGASGASGSEAFVVRLGGLGLFSVVVVVVVEVVEVVEVVDGDVVLQQVGSQPLQRIHSNWKEYVFSNFC